MEEKIRLIWDFRGPDCEKTAKHFKIHLSEFLSANNSIYFDFNDSLRPTSNKLREILFNWIHFEFKQGFECLDLFAGTGALGFEAISRNANKVTFIELNKKHYLNIKKNISKLGLQDSSKIFFKDAFSWISKNDLSKHQIC